MKAQSKPKSNAVRIFQKKITELALEAAYRPSATNGHLELVKWRFVIEGKPSAWHPVRSARGAPVAGWPRTLDVSKKRIPKVHR